MHILILTQILPYPPNAGPRIKTWHVIKYLVEKGHKITLVSFIRPEEQPYISTLQEICDEVFTVPIRRSRLKDLYYLARSILSGRPFLIERDDLSEMRKLVRERIMTGKYDSIHADQLTMTQFAFPGKTFNPISTSASNSEGVSEGPGAKPEKPILVFDAHNAVWRIVMQMGSRLSWLAKPFTLLESKRTKFYEGMIVRNFDHTTVVSTIDEKDLLQSVEVYDRQINRSGKYQQPPRISVIPITIDAQRIQPIHRQPGSKNILTLGTLHYPPNADGIRWFFQEVFPIVKKKVPDATLTIIGKNPPADFLQIASTPASGITVTGYVPELTPYLEKSALIVVPVRAGSGMRVRILEAFAQAMPVVTTTVGLEGITANHGEEVLVADTAEDFAECVEQVLQNADLQTRLSINGRALAELSYDWRSAQKKLDEIYN